MTAPTPVTGSVSPQAGESVLDRIQAATTPRIPFSVEFFPARDEEGEARLWRAAGVFEDLGAAYASVTYGAGGSSRERTVRITSEMARDTALLPLAHLTAVSHGKDELRDLCRAYADNGVTNLLVLRGDPPGDPLGVWRKHPEGIRYAAELVHLAKEVGDFHIGVASFPEGHFRAATLDDDTRYTVEKLAAGADYSITQIFFDVEHYLRLRDRLAALDPEQGAKPVIPSIMPITSLRSIQRMVELSGSRLPSGLEARFARAAGDLPEENRTAVRELGIEVATEMCERLIAAGAPCLHFDTLNFVRAPQEVLHNLGMAPAFVPAG